ncbi:MAG: glycoside hydrolase family 88 protein [Bacteroidaceae bacterium]|nr:glycoside hydrolase family 88 protein [Bacteroidaceae bacterium]
MMKSVRIAWIFVFVSLLCATTKAETVLQKDSVAALMKRVAAWQMDHYDQHHSADTNWENGALFVGMNHWAALAKALWGDNTYYGWLWKIGQRNEWQLGGRMYHADDIAVAQTWLALAEVYGGDNRLCDPTIARLDFVTSHPSKAPLDLRNQRKDNFDRWSWCDALFMAPPVYLKLYLLTGKKKYLTFMNHEYKATTDLLYDREEHLFFRDARYFGKLERNGRKTFWGRGNGWVMAGLAEILRMMPEKKKQRKYYVRLFQEMSCRLKDLQQPDGFWHASLLDPASYPAPETSSTGFITYALAFGINAHLLDRVEYLPTVIRGWQAMCSAVFPNGKLGYVQPIGADPQKVTRDMTEVYGSGAFLALGCEMYHLAEK